MPSVAWNRSILTELRRSNVRLQRDLTRGCQVIAELLQRYAEEHHGNVFNPAKTVYPEPGQKFERPEGIGWLDVTGRTQAGTHAYVDTHDRDHITVILTAETDYAKFIELAQDGKWAWLWPAIHENRKVIRNLLVQFGRQSLSIRVPILGDAHGP